MNFEYTIGGFACGFYELPDGTIVKCLGGGGGNPKEGIEGKFSFQTQAPNVVSFVKTPTQIQKEGWQLRKDLKDFPNPWNPKLPNQFDNNHDIRYLSDLVRYIHEEKGIISKELQETADLCNYEIPTGKSYKDLLKKYEKYYDSKDYESDFDLYAPGVMCLNADKVVTFNVEKSEMIRFINQALDVDFKGLNFVSDNVCVLVKERHWSSDDDEELHNKVNMWRFGKSNTEPALNEIMNFMGRFGLLAPGEYRIHVS